MGKIDIDGDLIRQLADLMNETGLTEIEVGAWRKTNPCRQANVSMVNAIVCARNGGCLPNAVEAAKPAGPVVAQH